MKKKIISILILLVMATSVFAGYYNAGDTEFTVTAGTTFPVADYFPFTKEGKKLLTFKETGFKSVGGAATLSYQAFVSKTLMLGGELGYNFAFAKSNQYYAVVPLTFKATFVPVQTGTFDLNLNIGAGVALMKYNTSRFFPAPFIKASVTPIYYITSSWGLGLDLGVTAVAEVYFKNDSKPTRNENTGVSLFAPITLSATYRH